MNGRREMGEGQADYPSVFDSFNLMNPNFEVFEVGNERMATRGAPLQHIS